MERTVIIFLLIQTLVLRIPSTNAQRSIQQYLHLTGLPYAPLQLPATTLNTVPNNQASHQIPTTGLTSLAALSLPNLIAGLPQSNKPVEVEKPNAKIDAKLLNNLAIALQLLILSNILNTSQEPEEEKPKDLIVETPQVQCYSKNPAQNNYNPAQNNYNPAQNGYAPAQNGYAPAQNGCAPAQTSFTGQDKGQNQALNQYFAPQNELMPGANFVGHNSFVEPNLIQNVKPRPGLNLMSPYEALGALTMPFPESVSQFAPSNARKDFQSPYQMIDSSKDYFPMNDLF